MAEAQWGYSNHSTPVLYPAKIASVPRSTARFQRTVALMIRVLISIPPKPLPSPPPSGRPQSRAINQMPAAIAACEAHP